MMYYYNTNSVLPYSFSRLKSLATHEIQKKVSLVEAPGVEIVSFAIMPTHFHLILKQTKDGDISRYLRRLEVSFAKFYNLSRGRHGGVFAGRFGSVKITSQYQLNVVSRYIHRNPIKAKLITINQLPSYPFTSYYLFKKPNEHVHLKYILEGFDNEYEYALYVSLGYFDNLDYLPEEF